MKTTYDPETGKFGPLEHGVPGTVKPFVAPSLAAGRVSLRPAMPSDYEFMHYAETTGEVGMRWRFYGRTPGAEEWAQQTFGDHVLAQFLVNVADEARPVGVVSAYDASFEHGHVKLAVARFQIEERSPAMTVAAGLFIRYVFATWAFRKIYVEVPEFNLEQFSSAIGPYFVEEGRLRDHYVYLGQLWDKVTLALDRGTWLQHEPRFLHLMTDGGGQRDRV